jgi:hypothetical protein
MDDTTGKPMFAGSYRGNVQIILQWFTEIIGRRGIVLRTAQ